MDSHGRRQFLKLGVGSAALGAWPGLIDRALAIAPSGKTGTIMDVEHVVIHMQENRSFDHYFGMLNGVRGLGDPRPLRLSGGRSVFAQPSTQHPDGHVLPYHGDSRTTRSFTVDGADQSHTENIHMFNRGRHDRWGHNGELQNRMLHYGPGDLPFYYALADAFTICDAYHCSTMTQTYPNRLHLFTGCNGGGGFGGEPEMSNYGEDETPSADMVQDRQLRSDAYGWTTYAERLQAAGIDWKVYQEYDNFGDNLLSVFPAFRPCAKDSDLYRRGRSWVSEHKQGADRTRSDGEQLVEAFRADLAADRLPQVSWIVTAADLSEHPTAEPAKGEHVTAKLIEALTDHPEVFAKTAFILTYDEAGGFFDHMPPPVPPVGDYRGHSTVPTRGETKDWSNEAQWAAEHGALHPIGLGIRTPTIVVSPWSGGGNVCSELFDHTSVLRFLEQRFGVREPNISDWRRSVCGDLTSAFDFARPDGARTAKPLPDTGAFRERVAQSKAGAANAIPAKQEIARQLPGQRAHRPLPYRFAVQGAVTDAGRLRIAMDNPGPTGIVLTVHDNASAQEPWHFTIGAGASHASEQWHEQGAIGSVFDLTLRGPNGFWRRFAGTTDDRIEVQCRDRPELEAVELVFSNHGTAAAEFVVSLDAAYPVQGARERRIAVPPGTQRSDLWRLSRSDRWYDLAVTASGTAGFLRRFAGKVENGKPGRTDPAIGQMRLDV
ncbi:phosphocholine-specific phospholipase C [Novosphingobium sp. FKTRR1]|uniref:phosphocholine-specific phospholipase C n=1 Tax=Novosphingobium sp. FKTRR1 TaxID=2879118 RepID=UPI001CF06666|nr:phospholipase C, phosphocholine-specific [Novosphingobium sp. FKTRR1]